MEVADVFVVNKSDRPDAEIFTNHIRQMIMEHGVSDAHFKVIPTIASQGVGMKELIQALDAYQIANKELDTRHKLIVAKVVQLIVAQKMRQLDLIKLEEDVAAAISKEGFNIFSFTQNYF